MANGVHCSLEKIRIIKIVGAEPFRIFSSLTECVFQRMRMETIIILLFPIKRNRNDFMDEKVLQSNAYRTLNQMKMELNALCFRCV